MQGSGTYPADVRWLRKQPLLATKNVEKSTPSNIQHKFECLSAPDSQDYNKSLIVNMEFLLLSYTL